MKPLADAVQIFGKQGHASAQRIELRAHARIRSEALFHVFDFELQQSQALREIIVHFAAHPAPFGFLRQQNLCREASANAAARVASKVVDGLCFLSEKCPGYGGRMHLAKSVQVTFRRADVGARDARKLTTTSSSRLGIPSARRSAVTT